MFLLAVVKLEGMRAELGDPSVMPQYFHNEGVNRGPLIGPLNDISEKVQFSIGLCWVKKANDIVIAGDGVLRCVFRSQGSQTRRKAEHRSGSHLYDFGVLYHLSAGP